MMMPPMMADGISITIMPISPFINFHGSPASESEIIVASQEGGEINWRSKK
jgi:hypothetical protein